MLRSTVLIAVVLFPCAATAEAPGTIGTSQASGPAQASEAQEARGFIQTYDKSSAYDGYWYPAPEKFVCKESVDARCMTE